MRVDEIIKEKKQLSEKPQETFNVDDKPVFAAGTYNGITYTENDLDEMITAFNDLKGRQDIPLYLDFKKLKLGHDNKQKLLQKDGYPAAGWVKELKRIGKVIFASFSDVPRIIKELIEKKAYRGVSSELWRNFMDGGTGKKYPWLLSAVSLLGADIPAVPGLTEWGKFYSQNEPGTPILFCFDVDENDELKFDFVVWSAQEVNDLPDSSFALVKAGGTKDESGKTEPRALRYLPYKDANGKIDLPHLRNALARISQTNLSPDEKSKARAVLEKAAQEAQVGNYKEDLQGENEMDLAAMEKMVQELNAKCEALQKQVNDLRAENSSLTTQKKMSDEKAQKLEHETKVSEIKSFIASKKAEGKILPAQEAIITAIMEHSDDNVKIKFSADGKEQENSVRKLVESLLETMPNVVKFAETASAEVKKQDEEVIVPEGADPESARLDAKVKKYCAEHVAEKITYEDALFIVAGQK